MNNNANHTWPDAVTELRLRSGITTGDTLLPNSITAKGWLACVAFSLLNGLLDRLLRYNQKDPLRRAQVTRRRRRLDVWEERQHSGLEKLHEVLSDMDIPEVDLNTVDMHEWLDYAFYRS
ncbi:hypothetical protein CDEST_14873 [Colletotrichum destructivum]|uniref:Uncharacterized protein n=1 Tax=Colletotrichum destructivum TaxID=34406 RepID=A0AAX4J2T5_9PEZI|nr:hypothetical protein CDEST_14873 [Colletotrichum destructivum]